VQVLVDGQALSHEQWSEDGRTFTIAASLTQLSSVVRIVASIERAVK
jgi:hypothetical protein